MLCDTGRFKMQGSAALCLLCYVGEMGMMILGAGLGIVYSPRHGLCLCISSPSVQPRKIIIKRRTFKKFLWYKFIVSQVTPIKIISF